MFPWGSGDPFAATHRQMEQMQQEMFGMTGDDLFSGGIANQAQNRSGRRGGAPARQPTVEEVDDHHEHVDHEPVVEEPDDPPRTRDDRRNDACAHSHGHQRAFNRERYRQEPQHPYQPHGQQLGAFGHHDPFAGFFGGMGMPSMRDMMGGMMMPGDMAAGSMQGGTSYSYSSTYSSSSGPSGVTYEESRTSRRGPNGRSNEAGAQVMEERRTVRDGRSGEEHMRLTRGLGDRQRTLERRRRNGGDEERSETLRGIEHGPQAQRFDQQWQEAAQQGFGGGGGSDRRRGSGRREAQPQLGFGGGERWV